MFIFIFQVLNENSCFGFVRARTSLGEPIYWKSTKSEIDFYINPNNNNGLSDEEISKILNSSLGNWNSFSNIKLKGITTSDSLQARRNDIIFTTSAIFSNGVLAVTSVSYVGNTGEILEADIFINDNLNFTANAGDTRVNNLTAGIYLGDVMSHELGHAVGLGHSQVNGSSMLFSAFNGQYSLHEDDQLGISAISPISNDGGSIEGTVIGSKNLFGIIGAQVQFISAEKGRVVGAVFTDANGKFSISNLALNDTYYIYINPVNIEVSVPAYYLTAQRNFCVSGNYRGGFFSKCDSRQEGYPQGIFLSSDQKSINTGLITIKCSLESPPDYLDKKLYGVLQNSEFNLGMKQNNGSFGNAYVGMFNDVEISDGNLDIISIDLQDYAVQSNLYLDLKFLSQDLYTPLRVSLAVYRNGSLVETFPDSAGSIKLDSDNNPNLNLVARVPMSLISTENVFQVQIKPISLTSDSRYSVDNYLPASSSFMDELAFYFLIASISIKNANGTFNTVARRDYKLYEDNKSCPDAPNSFALSGFVSQIDLIDPSKPQSAKKKQKDGLFPFSCASTDDHHQGPKGPLSMLLGLFLNFLIWNRFKTRIKKGL